MLAGAQVGAYRVLQQIGAGGMGEVWLAEHAVLGRRAAIKVLHAECSSRAEIVTRFFNEARAATAIADPGIVQVFDFGQHVDGSAYIVMELLDGEPLDKRLARHGRLAVPDALRIMRQVASTLGAAHARGIVHRDLKPENIFLVHDPEVPGGERAKILDFGIAKLAGDSAGVKTQTAAVMGTPTYMSPEQCRGAGQVDQRSDVYSLGCVLFMLIVGRPPFDAHGVGDIIAMHLREPAPRASMRVPDIPPAVDELVARCLEKDPARRYTSGSELASSIVALLGRASGQPVTLAAASVRTPQVASTAAGQTTLSTASGASMQLTPPRRSRVGLLAGIGVVGALGGVITIVALGGRSSNENAQSPPVNRPEVTRAAPAHMPVSPPAPPAPTTPKPDDHVVLTAKRINALLSDFMKWSRAHPRAACPTGKDLSGDASLNDGWEHPMTLTCTDQPADQIVGVVSAGPDGVIGTADDITSWSLGSEITSQIRGRRWASQNLEKPAMMRVTKSATTMTHTDPSAQRPANPNNVGAKDVPITDSAPRSTQPSKSPSGKSIGDDEAVNPLRPKK